MNILIGALLTAGAFAIAGAASATPASPWLARVGLGPRRAETDTKLPATGA